jgi:hypothetical protein
MSEVSGANNEVRPQSPLRPGPQTPHSIRGRPEAKPGMAFKRIRRSDCPLSLQWSRPPIDLGRKNRHVRSRLRSRLVDLAIPVSRASTAACAGQRSLQ